MTVQPGPSAPDASQSRLRGLVRSARARHRRAVLAHAALISGLPAACAAAVTLWLLPSLLLAVLPCCLLAVALAVAVGRVRLARIGDAVILQGIGGVRGFDDELMTWAEQDRAGAGRAAMMVWLAADLESTLVRVPTAATRPPARRLGRVRYLLPLLVVLVLAWWLAPVLSVTTPGLLGGGAGGRGPGGDGNGDATGKGGAASTAGAPPPAAAQQLPPPPEPDPEPEPPAQGPPPAPEPPAPFLDLPLQQQVVVPDFVGDSETRRAMAELALLPDGSGNQAAAGGSGQAPPPPRPRRENFAQAAERALQSRHVPPHEQAIVRRFFARLRQERP